MGGMTVGVRLGMEKRGDRRKNEEPRIVKIKVKLKNK